jgi:hypothetical protein
MRYARWNHGRSRAVLPVHEEIDMIASIPRRKFIAGSLATAGLLLLPACQSTGALSFTEAIRRLLLLSSQRAFVRLTAHGGYWDRQVAQIGLSGFLGSRGGVVASILTSPLFKSRLESAFADIAVEGTARAAPLVADAVRTVGIANAVAIVRGGPSAATAFLRGEMGVSLLEAMVPEVGEALRIANEPLVGQLLSALTGVDVAAVALDFSREIDDTIWNEIGIEEAAIRANPRATNDPLLIGAFGLGSAL